MNSRVNIQLQPIAEEGVVTKLRTTLEMTDASFKQGEVFDSLPVTLASCESASYTGEEVRGTDEAGSFTMTRAESKGSYGPEYTYLFPRDTQGTVTLCYDARVLVRDEMKGDPGLSVYRKENGCTACGMLFLLLPEGTRDYHVHYDLHCMDKPGICVCGFAEGDFTRTCDREELKQVYYVIGASHRYHKEGSKLTITWFEDNLTAAPDFCQRVSLYFDYMEKMFHDEDIPYFLMLYKTPRTKLTGTALIRCCFMGVGFDLIQDLDEIEDGVIHELVHNWLKIEDENALNSLYAEGTAEYYSLYLPYLLHTKTKEQFVDAVNRRIKRYYSNPYRAVEYQTAYEKSWTHSYAQTIPYSRGILLMMNLDEAIRRASGGQRCLDDAVTQVIDREKQGEKVTWKRFEQICASFIGNEASTLLENAVSGDLMRPSPDYFGTDYTLEKTTVGIEENGFDDTVRYQRPRIVTGLKKDSNACRAGLRDGDEILDNISELDASVQEGKEVSYRVRRGRTEFRVTYVPRGRKVECYQYKKKDETR